MLDLFLAFVKVHSLFAYNTTLSHNAFKCENIVIASKANPLFSFSH